MNVAAFDKWRRDYDGLSYADMKAFYDLVEADHPLQQAYDAGTFARFLQGITANIGAITVLEIGGWKGELAQLMLQREPDIVTWHNLEICKRAVERSVFESPKYKPVVPGDFVWTLSLPDAQVFVASHFIEHIRLWELSALFDNLNGVQFIGLQSPLQPVGIDWTGYHGSHILGVGWIGVSACLSAHGFTEMLALREGDFRAFRQTEPLRRAE